jgi:chaperonin GroEL
MTAKQIKFGDQARSGFLGGAEVLARAVRVTMGPKGGYAFLERDYGTRLTRDGVSVARAIELSDRFADMGARLLRDVAVKTSDDSGDGTTTATVLAHAIMLSGVKAVAAGLNPMDLRRGIDGAVATVVAELQRRARKVSGFDDIISLATVASNGDAKIGRMVAEAMDKVGQEGVITVEVGNTLDTELTIVEGLQFDRGYLSPQLITDAKTMTCELEDPYILVSGQKLSTFDPLAALLEDVLGSERSFLVIAEGIEGEALGALVVNKRQGGLEAAAVEGPSFGEHRRALLEDIAIVTGARVISEELGLRLENTSLDMLGTAKRAIITATTTTLVDGSGGKKELNERCNQLRAQIGETTSDTDEERLRERLAKLAGRVAVIRVGGATELEARERRDRFDNALRSARAALEEGVLPGGGVALLRAAQALDKTSYDNIDQQTGIDIVRRALSEPLHQIVDNAGHPGSVVAAKLLERHDANLGFDVRDGTYSDMIEAGIIDSTKVLRIALQNAASVGALLVTTEAMVALV